MERKEVSIYTKFEKDEKTYNIMAIKNDNIIKYIDLDNNIMIIDMQEDLIKRENNDYVFDIDLRKNVIKIYIKKLCKSMEKSIKVLLIEKNKKSYMVRYFLVDDELLNEYYIKF